MLLRPCTLFHKSFVPHCILKAEICGNEDLCAVNNYLIIKPFISRELSLV